MGFSLCHDCGRGPAWVPLVWVAGGRVGVLFNVARGVARAPPRARPATPGAAPSGLDAKVGAAACGEAKTGRWRPATLAAGALRLAPFLEPEPGRARPLRGLRAPSVRLQGRRARATPATQAGFPAHLPRGGFPPAAGRVLGEPARPWLRPAGRVNPVNPAVPAARDIVEGCFRSLNQEIRLTWAWL